MGKEPIKRGDRTYEPYWRQQIEANVTLARIIHAAVGELDTTWLVNHSQIWGTKADPGPAFASMKEIREMLFSGKRLEHHQDILGRFENAPPIWSDPEDEQDPADDDRDDPISRVEFWDADEVIAAVPKHDDFPFVAEALHRMGWPIFTDDSETLRPFITYFQRSTIAWKKRWAASRNARARASFLSSFSRSCAEHTSASSCNVSRRRSASSRS